MNEFFDARAGVNAGLKKIKRKKKKKKKKKSVCFFVILHFAKLRSRHELLFSFFFFIDYYTFEIINNNIYDYKFITSHRYIVILKY